MYDGKNVQGETIADMGGMKCMLLIARKIPNFDYEKFFDSYATMWREKLSLPNAQKAAENEHAMSYLRVNCVIPQFDEFINTFAVQPGDGMYVAPDQRVAVW